MSPGQEVQRFRTVRWFTRQISAGEMGYMVSRESTTPHGSFANTRTLAFATTAPNTFKQTGPPTRHWRYTPLRDLTMRQDKDRDIQCAAGSDSREVERLHAFPQVPEVDFRTVLIYLNSRAKEVIEFRETSLGCNKREDA